MAYLKEPKDEVTAPDFAGKGEIPLPPSFPKQMIFSQMSSCKYQVIYNYLPPPPCVTNIIKFTIRRRVKRILLDFIVHDFYLKQFRLLDKKIGKNSCLFLASCLSLEQYIS